MRAMRRGAVFASGATLAEQPMRHPISIRSLVGVGLMAGAAAAGVTIALTRAAQDDLEARTQAALVAVRAEAGYPGMTAAIVMPDGRVLVAADGWADAARHIPLTRSSRMPAASIGTTFVAAAILQAVDDGVLDLDRPIGQWIGGEPWFERIPNARALTLRMLLAHRSGIPNVSDPADPHFAAWVKTLTTDLDRTWASDEQLTFVFDKKAKAPPGAKFIISDMNYMIAGVVFEHAVGRPLFREIERRILTPMGLDQTVANDRRDWRDVVPGLLDAKSPFAGVGRETFRDGHFLYALQAEGAAGGLISTSRDLARWSRQLFEARVFSPARLAEMVDARPSVGAYKAGFSIGVETQRGGTLIYGHNAKIPGYQSQIAYATGYRLATAIQINSDPMSDPAKRYKLEPGECLQRIITPAFHELYRSKKR